MRLIDAEELDEKAIQFPNTSIWVPIEAVWDAPTINALPATHGKWVVWTEKFLGVFCSVCNKLSDSKFNYCPHCGARMDGDTHDQ